MSSPPPLTAKHTIPKTVDKLTIRPGDSVIVIREDESIEVFVQIPSDTKIKRAAITTLGMYWCLMDGQWRGKMDLRAAKRIEDILAGRD